MAYANATAARDRGVKDGNVVSLKMAANTTIYKGSLVEIDTNGYATYTNTASMRYAGVATETKTSGSSNGDTEILVTTVGVHSFVGANLAQTNVGDAAYWDSGATGNPQTITLSDPGTGPVVGYIVDVPSATEALVRIDGCAFITANQAS